MSFVPLRIKTAFSLLRSPIRLTDLIERAKELGYSSLGISDLNVMYAVPSFYNLCLQNGLKPIIGLTLDLPGMILSDQTYPLSLVAVNNEGYQNLLAISTLVNTNDAITISQLKNMLSGTVIILPALGEVNDLIVQGKQQQVAEIITKLTNMGQLPTDIKLGIDFHQSATIVDTLSKLAADNGLKLIADVEVDYLNSDDLFLSRVLESIAAGTKIENVFEASRKRGEYFLRPVEEIEQYFTDMHLQGALQELNRLVSDANVTIDVQEAKLPRFTTPNNLSSEDYLRQICEQGLQKRSKTDGIQNETNYTDRLKHELSIIHSMGFDDYFLIVEDVISFAHRNNIITGPGRGSAAGSLVAYVLRITDVDPIKYDLLFERFLNPERMQMPDIDLDIPDTRRDEVIQYVGNKYGHERVGQIITFGTLAAKQAIRDVGRTFGLSVTQQNQWSQAIPNALHISLKDAQVNSQRLQNLISDSTINAELFRVASQLEGLPRHYSTHAAGVVLSDDPLVNHVPLQNGNEGLLMSQYPKEYVEISGLLKMDFLGLRNLSILADVLGEVKDNSGIEINPSQIPLNDPATIKLFAEADTTGIFQFESSGIRNVLRKIAPTTFEDVALVNALYRPGPMENIDEVVKRKHSEEPIDHIDDSLKDILMPTYGVIVYQEQVMLVANTLAGFSLGQADMLRRAMSKKKINVMEEMKVAFINGAKQRGHSEVVAVRTFEYIEKFANYGFNKSHAFAYSKMAVELAYLKVHYPGEFYVSLLRSVQNNDVKVKQYIADAKKRHIQIVAPSINLSQDNFMITDKQIRFGLSSIKGIRSDFVKEIISERQTNGKFKSFQKFCQSN
ncbi:DNA polymerase III subunit alpha [Lentilactobacillus kosonis]|uniref:DNA-directed DNA polymerase n=1 Tax=Lentilactobacillus kosonis TaxID=2810561 RepID=A0A401FL37_9LACO|nr:DNA polymerase III subunit alpha [Lentilactobacillus kosonis]GAY73063.1 DNA polymerase III alpha subunit [Lentilactobacillus kosonis]